MFERHTSQYASTGACISVASIHFVYPYPYPNLLKITGTYHTQPSKSLPVVISDAVPFGVLLISEAASKFFLGAFTCLFIVGLVGLGWLAIVLN